MRDRGYLETATLEALLKLNPNGFGSRGARKIIKQRLKEELEELKLSPAEEELKFINYVIEQKEVSADKCNEYMSWSPREGSDKRTLYKKRNPYKIDYDKSSNCYVSLDIEVAIEGNITTSQDWECEL